MLRGGGGAVVESVGRSDGQGRPTVQLCEGTVKDTDVGRLRGRKPVQRGCMRVSEGGGGRGRLVMPEGVEGETGAC